MADPEIISPRGVPELRTDWLADVARRLAGVGFAALRALPDDAHGHLTDVVDGRTWTFELIKFSAPHDTVVEFDAELWAPDDDRARPTLRAGFALAPRWDETDGRVALVRTEIGPRGAVTFDPENWMVTVPLGEASKATASPHGVEAGEWTFDGGPPTGSASVGSAVGGAAAHGGDEALASLPGTRLGLAALSPALAGDAVPELLFPVFPATGAKGKGFLGRLRGAREPQTPTAILTVTAGGAIEVAWTGSGPAEDLADAGLVLGEEVPVAEADQITLRGDEGALTLRGAGLTVALS